MATALFITVGTCDLQLDRSCKEAAEQSGLEINDRPGEKTFFLRAPRIGGEIISRHYAAFSKSIIYPIIKPAVESVLLKNLSINVLVLFATDQPQDTEIKHRNMDTCFFADILQKKIKDDFGNKIDKIWKPQLIKDKIVFFDSMYTWFGAKFIDSYINTITPNNTRLYVLPQGGIDAVNTALLLRSIEYYPDVIHISKPQGVQGVLECEFPSIVRKNIKKSTLLHLMHNYDYKTIENLNYSDEITSLSAIGLCMQTGDFGCAQQKAMDGAGKMDRIRMPLIKFAEKAKFAIDNFEQRIRFFYITTKIQAVRRNYAEFLVRIFTLAENILIPDVERFLGGRIEYGRDGNYKLWNDLLDKKDGLREYLMASKIDGNPLDFHKPCRAAYKAIFDFAYPEGNGAKQDSLREIYGYIEILAHLRNSVAHYMAPISLEKIEQRLVISGSEVTLDKILAMLDTFFEVKEFDAFDELNDVMRKSF